ncbi:MAG: LacI family DNA-binding transcriptional regulator [Armatimonadota bacterium]
MGDAPELFRPGKPVTLKDIADRCGLHITTVSLALRGLTRRVNAETMARVQAVAAELGYNAHATHYARRMRAERSGVRLSSHTVAVMVPRDFTTARYFYAMFHGVLETLAREGYGVFTTFGEDLDTGNFHPVLHRGEIDGVIGLAVPRNLPQVVNDFRTGNTVLPAVTLVHQTPGLASVVCADEEGAYALAAHLLALGHRQLLHFHPQGDSSSVNHARFRGYARACADAGLDPAVVLHECTGYHPYGKDPNARDWVWSALNEALTAHPAITGILGQSDYVAHQVYQALLINGLRVPEDYSLTGFDDTHVIPGPDSDNILTTVHVPLFEIGVEAARLLLAIMRGEAAPDAQRVLPVEFMPRASTSPPRVV